MAPRRIGRFLFVVLSAACFALVLPGCDSGARSLPLDEELAETSLVRFLDAWKNGRTAADLKTAEPSIIAVDPDWNAGQKLLEYKVVGPRRSDGTNLHTAVDVTLQNKQGRSVKQQNEYVIGTRPVITIFRPNL